MSERLHGKPKKLRDDSWGAWVDGRPAPGECVTITANGGKSWDAFVDRVIYQGNDGAIVSLEERGASRTRRGRTDAGGVNEAPRDTTNDEAPAADWGNDKDYRSS